MTGSILARSAWVVLALAGLAMGFGGCKEEQLKQEIATLNARLEMSQSEKMALANEKATLQSENTTLKGQLTEAQRKLSEKPATGSLVKQPTGKRADFGPDVEVTETAGAITVTLPDAILFDSGKAELKASSKTTLGTVVAAIKKDYPTQMIRVEGHTDADPITKSSWKDNWELSCERALAVVRYLTSSGIGEKRVYASGFGQYTPRDSNATTAGKSRNRRVQIVIIK